MRGTRYVVFYTDTFGNEKKIRVAYKDEALKVISSALTHDADEVIVRTLSPSERRM